MRIAGRDLRYLLTIVLLDVGGPMTVSDLTTAVERAGFEVDGRPSKTISDALRWEIRKGRVVRADRRVYVTGRIPRSTRSWIRQHVARLTSLPAPPVSSSV